MTSPSCAVHHQPNEIVGLIDELGRPMGQGVAGAKLDVAGQHVVADAVGDDRRHLRAACVLQIHRVAGQGRELCSDTFTIIASKSGLSLRPPNCRWIPS